MTERFFDICFEKLRDVEIFQQTLICVDIPLQRQNEKHMLELPKLEPTFYNPPIQAIYSTTELWMLVET